MLVWFGFFVWWHINLCRLFNAKAIILKEQLWYYLIYSWEDKRVHTFSKGICPKVNLIAWLEFELTYYNHTVHHFNHYTMRTHPCKILESVIFNSISGLNFIFSAIFSKELRVEWHTRYGWLWVLKDYREYHCRSKRNRLTHQSTVWHLMFKQKIGHTFVLIC